MLPGHTKVVPSAWVSDSMRVMFNNSRKVMGEQDIRDRDAMMCLEKQPVGLNRQVDSARQTEVDR